MTGKGEHLGTVQRVVEVLRHLAETGETTVKDVSAALGLVPSTSHRMLDILTGEGLVERDGARRGYRIGPEFHRLAALVNLRHDIRNIARPYLQHAVDVCDETCVLGVYLPAKGSMIFADKVDSSQLLRYQLPLNSPMPILWGASGRAIAAFLPKAELDRVYGMTAVAPASKEPLPPRDVLDAELALIRERGFAVSHGQKISGAVGITAPVFDATDRVNGSFGLTIPEQRFSPDDEGRLGALIQQQAKALSTALGARRPGQTPLKAAS